MPTRWTSLEHCQFPALQLLWFWILAGHVTFNLVLNLYFFFFAYFKLESQQEETKKLQEKAEQLEEQAVLAAQVKEDHIEMEETQTTLETELEIDPLVEGDRSEEDRLTEAEKNERQRKMLQVSLQ